MTDLRKCLFPVAGYGTRFLPATKALPKEMLPILEKPLVQYGVEEAVEAGLDRICFVTGRGKRAIEDHFDRNLELEHQIRGSHAETMLGEIDALVARCSFAYTRQHQINGLGDAVLAGESIVGAEPFAVTLVDDLCFGDGSGVLSQMVESFREHQCCIVAVEKIPRRLTSRYGVVSSSPLRDGCSTVESLVEKPSPRDAPSTLAVIGRYILTPDIFRALEHTPPGVGGEIQLTDALNVLAGKGMVVALRFRGRRFDCGSISGFVEATNYCYRRRQRTGGLHA